MWASGNLCGPDFSRPSLAKTKPQAISAAAAAFVARGAYGNILGAGCGNVRGPWLLPMLAGSTCSYKITLCVLQVRLQIAIAFLTLLLPPQ